MSDELMPRRLDKDTELMIDALRGVAALLVFFTHAFDLAVSDAYGWNYASNPEGWRWARASLGHGGFFVWCFFMVSGVCIHLSISQSLAKGQFSWGHYAAARISRIYPLFLLGLVLALLAWVLHENFGEGYNPSPWRQLAASLLSLQILTTPFPAYETSWSLSCEMMYYAIWPAVLLLMRGRVSRATAFCLISVLFLIGAIMLIWKVGHRFESSTLVDGVWTVAVLFPVWVCGAWLGANWGSRALAISRRTWLASLLLCVLSEGLLVLLKFREYPSWAVHMAGLSSIPGLMLFLAGAHYARLTTWEKAPSICRWLGQFSYPCYILHMQLLLLLDHFVDEYAEDYVHRHPIWHTVFEFSAVLIVLVWLGPRLERAAMRWRASFLKGTRQVVTV